MDCGVVQFGPIPLIWDPYGDSRVHFLHEEWDPKPDKATRRSQFITKIWGEMNRKILRLGREIKSLRQITCNSNITLYSATSLQQNHGDPRRDRKATTSLGILFCRSSKIYAFMRSIFHE
ncbi:unnamed protein product [Dovyalis caffra]|uniref:Uncharacterized protein n=1 Tax=Dovyalis caffra TaxID=77055 RepID=A0AAV1S8I1_9ROSI|nr:unnamed protein product [Dovyalis caffra]